MTEGFSGDMTSLGQKLWYAFSLQSMLMLQYRPPSLFTLTIIDFVPAPGVANIEYAASLSSSCFMARTWCFACCLCLPLVTCFSHVGFNPAPDLQVFHDMPSKYVALLATVMALRCFESEYFYLWFLPPQ